MQQRNTKILLTFLLLAGMCSAALYEKDTIWKPTNSNISYIMGQNHTFTLVIVNNDNITFNIGASDFVTFYAVSESPGNITLFNVTVDMFNHTNELNATSDFLVSGLNWAPNHWIVYNRTDKLSFRADSAQPLTYTSYPYTTYNLAEANSVVPTTTSLPGTTLPHLNSTDTSYFADLQSGRPFQAARDANTDLMGGLFWLVIMGVIWVSIWLRTQNFLYPTMMVLVMLSVLNILPNNLWISSDAQFIIYGAVAAFIGLLLMKLLSPKYTE